MKRVESAYILAGGRSSRFGENKALVDVLGEPQIVRLARQLASDGLRVTLVAQSKTDYEGLGIHTIEDGQTNGGPLAGVLAALQHSHMQGEPWCIVCSCDMLDWEPEWRAVWDKSLGALQDSATDWDVALLTGQHDESDSFRPFPGLYRTRLYDEAAKQWESGVDSMRGFHSAIASRIQFCRIRTDLLPKSFNTPAELADLLKKPTELA